MVTCNGSIQRIDGCCMNSNYCFIYNGMIPPLIMMVFCWGLAHAKIEPPVVCAHL